MSDGIRKDLFAAGIIFALVIGFILGLFVSIASISIPTQEPQSPTTNHLPYIQTLEENGFRVENKSLEDSIWITPNSFKLFIELARWYDIRAIYYSEDTRGIYFWYVYDTTSSIRWDIP